MITSWTHPRTGEVVSLNAIESLIHQWQATPRDSVRAMAWDQLHRFGVALRDIVNSLERDLARGYDILETSPDDANEARWMTWEEHYTTACDALSLIEHTVADDRPLLISERGNNREKNRMAAGLASESKAA